MGMGTWGERPALQEAASAKRATSLAFCAALGFVLSACSGGGEQEAQQAVPSEGPSGAAMGAATLDASAGDATEAASPELEFSQKAGRSVDVSTDLYEFQYAYPDAAGAIAPLKAELDARLDKARKGLADGAREERKAAKEGGYPYRTYSYGETWKVVTDLPGWLSLSSEIYTYTGGAHGMSGFNALLWDRKAEALRKPLDLFASPQALSSALKERFCKALDRERAERRGGPVKPDDMFGDCIDPVEQTVLLGSSNGATFDRIGIEVGPYAAGPYAEGSYEVTLPVDGAVMRALKPQYRGSFSPSS